MRKLAGRSIRWVAATKARAGIGLGHSRPVRGWCDPATLGCHVRIGPRSASWWDRSFRATDTRPGHFHGDDGPVVMVAVDCGDRHQGELAELALSS